MSLAKTIRHTAQHCRWIFFFYIITVVFIYRLIYALKIQILILFQNRDTQTDMFCLLINFWKQCCGFIVIINRFLLQMIHFLSHIELKWKFGLRVYFFIHVQMYQRLNATNFQWRKIAWPENSKPPPKKTRKKTPNKQTKKNSIIRMSSFSLYDSMHGQYVNSSDGFATIELFFK